MHVKICCAGLAQQILTFEFRELMQLIKRFFFKVIHEFNICTATFFAGIKFYIASSKKIIK